MTGRILVIDPIATNRIVMKVKLAAACYLVHQASSLKEGLKIARSAAPDLVLAGVSDIKAALQFVETIKSEGPMRRLPLVFSSETLSRDMRLELLSAGADDVLLKPLDEVFLLARIRSLLRARDASEELRLRDGTSRALGFVETMPRLEPPVNVALVTTDFARAAIWKRDLEVEIPGHIEICSPAAALGRNSDAPAPDALILADEGESGDAEVLGILPELRARVSSRHSAVLAVLSGGARQSAVMALDFGANDVLTDGFDAKELALRLRTQLRKKHDTDRLRATVRDGLKLAVTDPLTGLYNRRYALPHLERVSEHARKSGRRFAVMLADLDRFKRVNDTYGHAAGDAVLVEVARRLRENLRGVDLIARIGGEEFLIAMPETSRSKACVAAERLRKIMKDIPVRVPGTNQAISVTMSIGIAMGPSKKPEGDADTTSVEVLMREADKALYASKSEGRDQVTVSLTAA